MIVGNRDVLDREISARGWPPMRVALELGISLNTAKALLSGGAVGSKTISAALRVLAPLGFDDLFCVVGDGASSAPAGGPPPVHQSGAEVVSGSGRDAVHADG